jgi:hypothetical protein
VKRLISPIGGVKMFVPVWVIHVITTLVFVIVLFGWGFKTGSEWDFSFMVKLPLCIIGYLIYWIVVLAVK